MIAVNAVLFDRDHTITIDDPPYNGDPDLVRPMPGAVQAVARLRAAGVPVGVVTNQAGIGLGLLTREQVESVNARVDELVGPFDTWQYCPHAPGQECSCRKPAPGLVLRACDALGVDPRTAVVIGDTVMDVGAAESAGAIGILVLTDRTRPSEIKRSRLVCRNVLAAVDWVLASRQDVPA
jgi:D-glycero-D-manno-heptose 1,7-bisphosphate phosphatase